MSDTLQELGRYLVAAAAECAAAIERGDMEQAKVSSREVLSAGSKLHQRLGILVDLSREARWVAAVDRAVPKPPPPVDPNQLSIDDELKRPVRPKPPAPRKPRGKG